MGNFSVDDVKNSFSIEVIDKCIRNLKPGKACGPDELSAEHLQHAHPSITKCIHKLFSVMVNYGLAPKGFGSGIVVPFVKDKTGDIHSANNYRPITLVPIISKLFEAVILECYGNCFVVDDLQFGFKKGLSCSNAIFTIRTTIDHFTRHGSSIYAAALNISKAFDTVQHYKLFKVLVWSGLPKCLVSILLSWYCNLEFCVRWYMAMSKFIHVGSGVRQGGVLRPSLFNLFIHAIIMNLKLFAYGCHINNIFRLRYVC